MNELITKSLAQIVNTNHRAATVFEKYHLDFCCKGKRTLQQACTESDLKIEEVLSDLGKTIQGKSDTIQYQNMSLTQLADYIVLTHHSYVKKEMPAILGYLEKVASKHGGHHPEMIKVLEIFAAVKEELEQHMQKEEQILFPRIKEVEQQLSDKSETIINNSFLLSPISVMEQEHEHAGNAMAAIRQLTNNYTPPTDACTTYRLSFAALQAFELDLHQHVHLENNILFPKALRLFEPSNQCSLN